MTTRLAEQGEHPQPAATPGSPDAASVFADFAAGLDFRRIPPDVVERAKKLIIDQLGVM